MTSQAYCQQLHNPPSNVGHPKNMTRKTQEHFMNPFPTLCSVPLEKSDDTILLLERRLVCTCTSPQARVMHGNGRTVCSTGRGAAHIARAARLTLLARKLFRGR